MPKRFCFKIVFQLICFDLKKCHFPGALQFVPSGDKKRERELDKRDVSFILSFSGQMVGHSQIHGANRGLDPGPLQGRRRRQRQQGSRSLMP